MATLAKAIRIAATAMSTTAPMASGERGAIVNTASAAAEDVQMGQAAYAASKAGVIQLTRFLAIELGPFGITSNSIAPITTLTPRVRKVRDAASIERIKNQNPMKTLVEPEDCAAAVLFLASKDARYITGVNLNVNAGNIIV